jgi:hypothetical protein
MVFKVNHVVEGQSPVQGQQRDQVQGNPHPTIIFYDVNIKAGRHFGTNLTTSTMELCPYSPLRLRSLF